MKITIEGVGMELSPSVRAYISLKFELFQKFLKRFEGDGELTLYIEVVRTTRHHQKGEIYEVVAGVRMPKKSIRVAESAEDVYIATDKAKNVLRGEIEKYKEKMTNSKKTREGK